MRFSGLWFGRHRTQDQHCFSCSKYSVAAPLPRLCCAVLAPLLPQHRTPFFSFQSVFLLQPVLIFVKQCFRAPLRSLQWYPVTTIKEPLTWCTKRFKIWVPSFVSLSSPVISFRAADAPTTYEHLKALRMSLASHICVPFKYLLLEHTLPPFSSRKASLIFLGSFPCNLWMISSLGS